MGEYSLKKILLCRVNTGKQLPAKALAGNCFFSFGKFSKRLGNSQKLLGQSVIALNVEMHAVGQTVGVGL